MYRPDQLTLELEDVKGLLNSAASACQSLSKAVYVLQHNNDYVEYTTELEKENGINIVEAADEALKTFKNIKW